MDHAAAPGLLARGAPVHNMVVFHTPAPSAAHQLLEQGALAERKFLRLSSSAQQKPPLTTLPIPSAAPWTAPRAASKACSALDEDAISSAAVAELLGVPVDGGDSTGVGLRLGRSDSRKDRERRDELERINGRIHQAIGSWEEAIRPLDEWDELAGEEPEEVQATIEMLLMGKLHKHGISRREVLAAVADTTHQAKQLKQIETIERESRESQDQAQEEDSAVVDALVAQITACKERLDALHKKEMEELEKLRSSMSALDAELLDRRAADDGAAAKQRDLEAALREAQAKAQSLADQKELDDKAAARAAEQMRELNSQLHALKHKADVAAEAAELRTPRT